MLKLLRRLLILTAVILFVCVGSILNTGWVRYRRAIEEMPLKTAVDAVRASRNYVPFDQIDRDYVNAVVAVEDKRFFSRSGFDYAALVRAMINNFRQGKAIEGGSTIPQQTAKNLYFIGRGKTRGVPEKVAEVFLMYDMEEQYTKQDILALYAALNYYGDGYWGLDHASRGYYGVPSSDLTIAQSAMLAGIPNAPSVYQLSSGYDLALSRQRRVLSNMRREGYLSEEDYQEALNEDVHARSGEESSDALLQ